MRLTDMLKDLLGIHRDQEYRSQFPDSGKRLPRDIEEELWHEFGRNIGSDHPNHNQDMHGEFHGIDDKMFKEFEDMFNSFFKGHHFDDVPSTWSFDHRSLDPEEKEGPLRDKMLKDPGEENPSNMLVPFGGMEDGGDRGGFMFPNPHSLFGQIFKFPFSTPPLGGQRNDDGNDKDLDNDFSSGKSNLDDLLSTPDERETRLRNYSEPWGKNFSFHSYSQITTRRGADGVVESQKTVKDSEGNEEVIVSRTIGDQTHTYRKKRDSEGNEEVLEDLVNMKEDDVSKFDDAWKSLKPGQGNLPALQGPGEGIDIVGKDTQGLISDLIKDFVFDWKFK